MNLHMLGIPQYAYDWTIPGENRKEIGEFNIKKIVLWVIVKHSPSKILLRTYYFINSKKFFPSIYSFSVSGIFSESIQLFFIE